MKIRTAIAAAFALAVGLGTGPAHAVCTDLSLRSLADVGFYGADQYHVFAATETGQVIGFDVRHSNKDDPCDYFVTFSRGDSLTYDRRMTYAANELHYQIYDGPAKANVLKDIGDAGTNEVIAGTFTGTGRETQTQTFFVAIPPEQVLPPFDFRDDVVVRLYEGTPTSYVLRDSATIQVAAGLEHEIDICIACPGAFDAAADAQVMNFGTPQTGEERTTALRMRSNDGYTLYLQSDNRGVLRTPAEPSTIPYVLQVDGVGVNLSGRHRTEVARVPGVNGPQGDLFDLRVVIGDVANALPGEYRDHITITVTAY